MNRFFRIPLLCLAFLLTGCYLPTDFQAELQIDKRGNYIFRYAGKLTHLGLLQQLAQKQINELEGAEKVAVIQRDLARDKGFGPEPTIKERVVNIKHLSNATFEVKYKRQGNIDRQKSYSFVRFNARMLGISRVPNNAKGGDNWIIKVFGDRPNKDLVEALEKANLKANGRLRIQTDAKILKHNADKQYTAGGLRVYVWNIKSMKQEPPHLSFELQR
jgi:hypothetical protein